MTSLHVHILTAWHQGCPEKVLTCANESPFLGPRSSVLVLDVTISLLLLFLQCRKMPYSTNYVVYIQFIVGADDERCYVFDSEPNHDP